MAGTVVRVAAPADAAAVARIGRSAVPAQYAGLVDPAAIDAALERIYAEPAVADCIRRCAGAPDAHFLVDPSVLADPHPARGLTESSGISGRSSGFGVAVAWRCAARRRGAGACALGAAIT